MRKVMQVAVTVWWVAGCGSEPTVPAPEVTQCALKGEPTVVAGQLMMPRLLALDGDGIWWSASEGTTPATDALFRSPKQGAAPERLAAGLKPLSALAAHQGQVFWADGSKQIFTLRDGAPAVVLEGAGSTRQLVADARGLFFIDSEQGAVKKVGLDGAGLTTLATGQRGPTHLSLDDRHAYWVNIEGHKIAAYSVMKVPLEGGEVVTVTGEHAYAAGLEVDATHLYISTTDRLLKVGKNGEGLEVLLTEQTLLRGPVGDSARLYFSRYGDKGSQSLVSFDKRSRQVVTIATSAQPLLEVRADASGVYWLARETNASTGAISRACE